MKARDFIFLIIGGAVAVTLHVLLGTPTLAPVPTVAGQQVPAERVSLNFTNWLTFYCETSEEFHDCRVVGFTGETSGQGSGISSSYVYFDNWIVLENTTGHRFYVRPGDIRYIEDDTAIKEMTTRSNTAPLSN